MVLWDLVERLGEGLGAMNLEDRSRFKSYSGYRAFLWAAKGFR